jgi:hypothetical protein
MTDSDIAKNTDGFDYDRDGHVIPPAGSMPWDLATGALAFAIPVMALRLSLHSPLPPLGLQGLKIFQLALSRGLVSESQLRNAELLLAILVVARLASYPSYFKKYTRLYSEQRRPPEVWRKGWPRQNRVLFLAAAISIGVVELTGFLIDLTSFAAMKAGNMNLAYPITAREVSVPIFILSLGLWFLAGGLLSTALYRVFYRRYWAHST